MSDPTLFNEPKGVIAWMTENRITPNLMMIVLLVGGFFFASQIKQEVFPEFEIDIVRVNVPYPGSSPEEVEQGIVLAVEEAIRSLEGIGTLDDEFPCLVPLDGRRPEAEMQVSQIIEQALAGLRLQQGGSPQVREIDPTAFALAGGARPRLERGRTTDD